MSNPNPHTFYGFKMRKHFLEQVTIKKKGAFLCRDTFSPQLLISPHICTTHYNLKCAELYLQAL